MGPAEEILQQDIRIPLVRIVRGGQVDCEMLNLMLLNECTSREREGDLDAQIGPCRVGGRRILEVAEKYGERRLHALIDELLDYSERLVRAELRKMPAGEFSAKTGSMTMA
jgi:N-methylhydantoinase B